MTEYKIFIDETKKIREKNTLDNKEYQKQYRLKNKDKLKEYAKKKYLDNPKIFYDNKKMMTCDICKCNINYFKRAKHFNTKKHINNTLKNNNSN